MIKIVKHFYILIIDIFNLNTHYKLTNAMIQIYCKLYVNAILLSLPWGNTDKGQPQYRFFNQIKLDLLLVLASVFQAFTSIVCLFESTNL